VIENLEKRGYHVRQRRGTQGVAEGIIIDRKDGILFGSSDSRGYGGAVGY
jgi:gamma-glutamyltranspeptidase